MQEAVAKIEALAGLQDIEWHLIGPLQSNKAKLAAERFDWVQSVDRDKIARSISMAVRKRPVDEEQVEQMVNNIVRKLESMGESEIPTDLIGEMVMESLSGLDPVGFIRYASVYKDFKTPADFAAFVAKQTEDHDNGEKE